MRPARARGLVLVPVAIALAVTGALAWAMVREGSMSLAAVQLGYETQVARYLAEAGLNLARWQNEQSSCNNAYAFGTFSLPGGTVKTNDVHSVTGGLSIDVSATTPGGGSAHLVRASMPVYDPKGRKTITLYGKGSVDDAWLDPDNPTTMLGTGKNFFYLTDDGDRAVVKFILATIPDSLVVQAQMQIAQTAPGKTLTAAPLVYVHRVTTSWQEVNVTWNSPWQNPGGDFIDPTSTVIALNNKNGYFTTRIDALADGWMRQALPNTGVLLTSSGLNQAMFGASEDDGHSPKIIVDYYPRCK